MGWDSQTLPESAPKNGSYKDYILGLGDDGIEKRRSGLAKLQASHQLVLFNWLVSWVMQKPRGFLKVGGYKERHQVNKLHGL